MNEIVVPSQIQESIKQKGTDLGFIVTKQVREEFKKRYQFAAERINPTDAVLDVGCGLGLELPRLNHAQSVFAIDISPERASRARKLNKESSNIRVLQMDAVNLDVFPDDFFNKVVAMEVIEHIEDYSRALSEMTRVLDRKGSLIISTPNFDISKNIRTPEHIKEFGKNELINVLVEFFDKVELFGYGRSRNNSLSAAYLNTRDTPVYALYRRLPLSLKSALHSPVYKLLWGNEEIYKLNGDDSPRQIIAVCENPKK